VSLRSGFEVASGPNCRMIPLSNPLAFNPTYPYPCLPSIRIPSGHPIPYQALTIPEMPHRTPLAVRSLLYKQEFSPMQLIIHNMPQTDN
jgi:hypothetical protein